MRISLPNDFNPRAYQRRAMAYFDGGGKRAVTVWHRRAGKDLAAGHQTCKMAHEERGAYWHIFPTATEARRNLWTGFTRDGRRLMEQIFPAPIRRSPKAWAPQGEMVVELKCGSIWRLMGSDKMSLVGAGPKGVVFSEYSLARPNTWDLVRPMLRESRGWAWFIYTPRGKNHGWRLYEAAGPGSGWYRDVQTVHDTGLTYASNRRPGVELTPDEMMEEELAEGMPPELVAQEYRCDWTAANVGSFYGVLLAALERLGAIGQPFGHGRDDVFTSWDLGRADDTAIWWFRLDEAGNVDVLDHYASHGEDLEHYFQVVDERQEVHGWRYRKHWLPHDARAKTLATKVSVLDQFLARYGSGAVAIGPDLGLLDGIQAVRWLLLGTEVKVRFHPRCSECTGPKDCDGVEALRAYHREWDAEKKCFRQTPVHDWSSHTADSFRGLACVVKVSETMTKHYPPSPKHAVAPPSATLEQLWAGAPRSGGRV